MTRLLRDAGMTVNQKRVQRLWREERLRNPLRKRRKRARGHSENSCALKKAKYKNHVWCWDFTMDETADGRRLKWFSVLDEFTRECLALEVERRMTARDVMAILAWLKILPVRPERSVPTTGRSSSRERCSAGWRHARSDRRRSPGSPWENGYSESFNSRMKAGGSLRTGKFSAHYWRPKFWERSISGTGIRSSSAAGSGTRRPAAFAAELGPDSLRSVRPKFDQHHNRLS